MRYDIITGGTTECSAKSFTLADLIQLGRKYENYTFKFVGTHYHPSELISWRGSYNQPCITYSPTPITGGVFAQRLTDALGVVHYGYKGGEYYYYGADTPYVAQYRCADEYQIVGYDIDEESNTIILNTQIVEW